MTQIDNWKQCLNSVIVGKEEIVEYVITALLAGGHVLMEDMPGTGKTMLAKTLARSVDAEFSRVQFTPDLLPSDITGLNVYNQKEGEFSFHKGPVFCNILLADEINRATPRTQASLLECMEEGQVTIDGKTYPLDPPFFVIATQNPIETAGTFPLPEAQLDRFLMRLSMGMVSGDEERELLKKKISGDALAEVQAVCTGEEVMALRRAADEVFIHDDLIAYICRICDVTRDRSDIIAGVSPRGAIALMRAARAYALVKGRSYVIPEDIKALAVPVLAHRLVLLEGFSSRKVYEDKIAEILESLPVPTEDWTH